MFLEIHPENPNQRNLDLVLECLRDGGVIIYPTDTIYGIGCDIMRHKAIEKVAKIKGVKPEKANFSFVCCNLSQLSDYAKQVDNQVFKLMKRTLPGPYTFILNASTNVPKLLKSKKKTVGIRIPDHNVANEIVCQLNNPIISTSVHDDDEVIEYTTDPELIYEKYRDQVDIVIDSGFGKNVASTVVDCSQNSIDIIREGEGDLSLVY